MSCQKAIGVAKDMKEVFGEKIELSIYTTDSEEAQKYDFRSSTNVLLNDELIPLKVCIDRTKMQGFLTENLMTS
ncbi:MAG: hypothetical protein HQK77_21170 [Desulfobacterales bacterium]|nr:hypothetical protein [Desulfobacterales bacterium]